MAFAAVSSLIETLEDLLRFTFLALKIKKLQIKILVMQPSNNFIRDSLRNFLMHWHLMTPKYIAFIAIPPNKEDTSSSEFDKYIFSLKMRLYLLQRRAKDILDLWLVLSVLLTFLRDSETICHDLEKMQYLERSLIDLAHRIEDKVEETVIDHSIIPEAFSFINVVVNEDPMFIMGEPSFMSQILDRFNERRGLQINLQRASEENQNFDANDGFMSILKRVMNGSSSLELVAIVGMGGIGKTTLAQRIFDSFSHYQFDISAWVVVSQEYQVRSILKGILSCISRGKDELFEGNDRQLPEMLWGILKGKRFLIVLDNIWSTKAWDDIKRCFPDDRNGSRIVLTTRKMKVADYVNPRQPPLFVNLLDIEQSWTLLHWKVFGGEPCPSELEYVGRKIARKCQGLPLAIVVIAGILRKIKRTCDCWQDIAESVKSVVSSDPEQCLEILALGYNHLPNHLKACFLYMGAFPEDCEIEVRKLIRLWIAEGFLDKKLDASPSDQLLESESHQYRSELSLKIEAETYLKDLIDRNLVLVGERTFSGEIRTCRLHDVIRDLCIREAQKENFMHVMRMDSEAHSATMINPRRLSHDHEKMQYLERSLIDLASRIEDTVEETVIDHSIIPMDCSFIDEDLIFIRGEISFMSQILDVFNERCGLQINLQRALMEICLIKGEMKMIYDRTPIVDVDLQSGQRSVVIDSLQHMTTEKNQVSDADEGFLSILERVTRDSSPLELVAIVGMGGIGKTTLAQRIFYHPFTCHHFHIRAWVVVSQAYQVRGILTGILSYISQVTDEICKKSNGQLADTVRRSLKGQRYLIVLDNIWSTKAWDDIKSCIPDDKNGSRIVLTTRERKVAEYVNPRQPPHYVNLLDIEQSWKLLKWKVFGEEPCPSELEDVGRRIARKCQGLPLVIVIIAGILRKMEGTCDCWQGIAESVNSVISSDPEQCLEILALSYRHLPNHLKACFLYMGAFPEDCEIEVRKLIRLWIAEGFLDKKLDAHAGAKSLISKSHQYLSESSLEIEAETYLKDLIDRNLVLVGKRTFSGEIRTCRLHEVMQDLCIREAQKENFMHVIRMDSEAHSASMNNRRRLSLQFSSGGHLLSLPSLKLLRSFLCFSLGFGSIPDTIFFQVGFKLLRVLDIIFLHFQSFPDLILQLVHLRYLAFTATYELPVSISELKNLQTLIIRGPWIPDEFGDSPILLLEYWDMPWLRHLHTTVACYLRNPFILKNDLRTPFYPQQLQSLSFIMFSSCSPEVFSLMPNIKKLGIFESEEDYKTDASSKWLKSLVHLKQLEELKCSFHAQNRSPRNSLHWLFPSSLKELTLSWSYVLWENMTPVAMLPELEVLKLKNHAFLGVEWEPSDEGFRYLKHLLIENHDLVHLEASRVHFPRLEHLALRSCRSLGEISFDIAEIPTLQLIELYYCGESAENSAKEIQEQIDDLNVDIRTERS